MLSIEIYFRFVINVKTHPLKSFRILKDHPVYHRWLFVIHPQFGTIIQHARLSLKSVPYKKTTAAIPGNILLKIACG